MHGSSLPPPHPSLPRQPATYHQTPHDYSIPSYYNSHYVQAYSQGSAIASVMNNASSSLTGQNSRVPIPNLSSHLVNNSPASGAFKTSFLDSKSFWYQPGNNHCKQQGCAFFGSHKSVEIHMMDRHLIYPPDWEKRKKKSGWDADPSLKGKPIPIQGTSIVLDSPEILDAWISERKKRFPTSSRVDEKKRKLEEAVARGQLDIAGATLRSNKRQKCDHRIDNHGSHQKMPSRTAKNGKDQTRTTDAGWGDRVRAARIAPSRVVATAVIDASHSNSEDTDGEPEVLPSKIQPISEIPAIQEDTEKKGSETLAPSRSVAKNDTVGRSGLALQPKNPLRNPFASRPTLLRNLLLPEICITVSNLSQAIRFLVDNNFLQNVELTPGQAFDQKTIEVLDS